MSPPIRRFALLLGVNDYDVTERSNGAPLGSLGLLAPRNDVAAWFHLLRRLDVSGADIEVCTSPALTPAELGSDAVRCGPAIAAHVTTAVAAFTRRCAEAGPGAVGLVVVIGHGDYSESGHFRMALADYGGPLAGGLGAEGTLCLRTLRDELLKAAPTCTLTMVVDICRHGADPAAAGDDTPANVTVLAATRLGERSYERCHRGSWRGQFSWALQTVLEQWPRTTWEGSASVAIDHRTLVAATGKLMAVFDDPGDAQAPELIHKGRARSGVFLLPRGAKAPTSRWAGRAPGHEFQGGTSDFTDQNGNCIGTVQVNVLPNGGPTHAWWQWTTATPFVDASGTSLPTIQWKKVQQTAFGGNTQCKRSSFSEANPCEYPMTLVPASMPLVGNGGRWWTAGVGPPNQAPSSLLALQLCSDGAQAWYLEWYLALPQSPVQGPPSWPASGKLLAGPDAVVVNISGNWTWYRCVDRAVNVPARLPP